ncbi:MAG: pyruvate formate lyase-activating protein [Ruminococcus sp.]|nr:pyruvate formate lyase-activating protein [Ruminococcus sp.]
MIGHIHSTESFGTVDGPGVRFVVFFQGCPLRCLYCHNPDTWEFGSGKKMTPEELLCEYDSYREFLRSGGITATGGEPLAQAEFLAELFRLAKEKGVHTCLDTSGAIYNEAVETALKYTDLVMLDIKHTDSCLHKKLTGIGNEQVLAFAEHLRDIGKPMWVRRVVVPGITDSEDELFHLGEYLADFPNLKALDVLPYHDLAREKYAKLGLDYPLPSTPALPKEDAIKAKNIIMNGLRSALKRGNDNGEH